MLLDFIIWQFSPEIFSLGPFSIFGLTLGPLTVRWYGVLFMLGFAIGYQILSKIYKQEGRNEKDVDTILMYVLVATIIGARLGHCLFYEPEYFLSHPIQILFIWQGGLASHGATIGILLAVYLYSRKHPNQSFLYLLDRIVITIALGGCFIRLGNLANSEIVGRPSDTPTAFVFVRPAEDAIKEYYQGIVKDVSITQNHKDTIVEGLTYAGIDLHLNLDTNKLLKTAPNTQFFLQNNVRYVLEGYSDAAENIIFTRGKPFKTTIAEGKRGTVDATIQVYGIPRLPAQLYESISSFLLFILLFYIYNSKKGKVPEGRIFGLFVVILFSLRFIYEFFKEAQVEFENSMALNMGQLLSIPLVIAGLFVLMRSFRKKGEIS